MGYVGIVAFGLSIIVFVLSFISFGDRSGYYIAILALLLVAIFGAVWRVGDILEERFKR